MNSIYCPLNYFFNKLNIFFLWFCFLFNNKYNIFKIDFSNYQKNQRLHSQLNDSANFLLQVSDSNACSKIKEKLLGLNKRWKMYQDRFKETNNEQYLKYYECEHSLNMVKERLNKIDSLAIKQCKCSLSSIGKYQEELQKAYNDIECLDANLKLINKLTSRIDLKQNPNQMRIFVDDLRSTETKLVKLRATLPDLLKNLTKIHSHISSIDDGLQSIECWIIEAENLIKIEPDQLNIDQIMKQVDRQQVFSLFFK